MRRWSFTRLLVVVAVVNLLLGGALFALRPPGRDSGEDIPPPELPAQAEVLRAKVAAGQHGEPYALDLSDEELTATAGYFLARAPDVPFARVTVAVRGEKLVIEGATKGLGVTVPVRLTGSIDARDGLPRAAVDDVSLGETPLPGLVRERVLHEINRSLDFSRYGLALTVDGVELRPGGMTIRGTIK
jgi:hypothetical protein